VRIEEFFVKYARGRGVTMAQRLAVTMRRLLSTRSPRPPLPAIPLAPPRLVTGRLKNTVSVVPTARGARVVVWAPHAPHLEYNTTRKGFPHKFVKPALVELGITGRASGLLRRG
jgi:hypothetical protein